jgi:hypothetical protein
MKGEQSRLQHEQKALAEHVKENLEKVKMNKQLPYLVANVVEASAAPRRAAPRPTRRQPARRCVPLLPCSARACWHFGALHAPNRRHCEGWLTPAPARARRADFGRAR